MNSNNSFEVIIIGGSYAGLSAAMSLGRSLRKVLIIDNGNPCNKQTPHSHNFLTHDGEQPGVISMKGKEQVLAYPTVEFLEDTAVEAGKNNELFEIKTESGNLFTANIIILAYGIKDILPDITGMAECWGISVIHCPYCHGFEARDKKTAIMAFGDRAMHLGSLVKNLTQDLSIITCGETTFLPDQLEKLDQHKIRVIDKAVAEIIHKDGQVETVVFDDDSKENFEAVYAVIPFVQHSDLAQQLNCEFTETGYIKVDHFHQTTIEGVFACGDNANMMRSVANAVHSGNLTGAIVNGKLVEENF